MRTLTPDYDEAPDGCTINRKHQEKSGPIKDSVSLEDHACHLARSLEYMPMKSGRYTDNKAFTANIYDDQQGGGYGTGQQATQVGYI